MKIKLTDRQALARKAFRESVLDHFWGQNGKVFMFNVVDDVSLALGISGEETLEVLNSIPSVGKFAFKTPVSAWLARHYHVVSKAMFDHKPREVVLDLWKTQKYQRVNAITRKRSREDMREMARTNSNERKNNAICELKNNMPDRWAATDWGKVK